MSHLHVYRNQNPATKRAVPYVLDVQSELLSELETRVVVPLYLQEKGSFKAFTRLTPVVEIEGKKCVVMTPQLAGVHSKLLKKSVCSLEAHRPAIIDALDLLFTGF